MNLWRKVNRALAGLLSLDLTHAQCHYAAFLQRYVGEGVRWLEIGCGRNIVPDWAMPEAEQRKMVSRCSSLTGLDVDKAMKEHPLLTDRVMGLAGSSPFQDESFGLVTANMVVEHVDDCTAFLADIYRILKPGGAFVFHTPNFRYYLIYLAYWIPDSLKGRIVWLLERRCEDDLFATRYHMNTVPCIQQMAEKAGFQVEEIRVVGSAGSFWQLGPLGTLECFILKALSILGGGKFRSNLLCALRKQPAVGPSALDRPGQANSECR